MEPVRGGLEVEGGSCFRHHLSCALLAHRPVRVRSIGLDRERQGLNENEVNFMKFVDRVTSGSKFEVRDGTTDVLFSPGMILGGVFSHAVPKSRSVTYVIEAALLFLPFAKHASEITFTGCTQHDLDMTPDTIRTVTTRWLRLFGVECQLRIVRRGAPPDGDGCVILTVSNVRKLRSVAIENRGKIRRVRGIAFSSNASADLTKQAASAAKGVLLDVLPDVYVVADNFASPSSQRTAGTNGYGLMLVAESTEAACVLSQQGIAKHAEDPNTVGRDVAKRLLSEVALGGCVDSAHQLLVLLLMAVSPDEASTVRLGSLSPSAVSALTIAETFFGVSCAVKEEENPYGIEDFPPSVVVSCIGCNCQNVAKRSG